MIETRECPTTAFIIRNGAHCGVYCLGLNMETQQCEIFDDECLDFDDDGNLTPCPACDAAWAQGEPVGGDGGEK